MKKLILLLAVTLVLTTVTSAQYIPFTNTNRIFDLDTGNVMKFYKVPLPQAGYKNFYVQRGGFFSPPYTFDMRYGNMLRYIYSANGFSDSAHYSRFHNSWAFQYGYYFGYILDFAFSAQDTNLFLYAYQGANWEPADGTGISYNNGLTVNGILPTSLMNNCGGMAIDPVNDSIMYVGYNAQLMTGNVHKSTNRGANWICVDTLPESIYGSKLFVNKFNRNTIFISKNSNLYRSTTGGTDFLLIKTGVSNVRMLFDVSDNTIYMSSTSTDGFLKSTNNGTNWTTLMNKAVYDFEFDPLNSNIVFAGCQDGLYKSINKGSTWTLYNNSFMPDINVKGIVKNPNTGDTLFVSTGKAVYKVYGPSVIDTSVTSYFPMTVGNVYVYQTNSIYPPFYSRQKVRILKDTIVSGKRFYYFSGQLPGFWNYGNWYRMDGVTGVVTGLANNYSCNYLVNERYVDSLKSRKNDSLRKCGNNSSVCFDTSNITVFGIPTKQKAFREDGLVITSRYYSKYFGITHVYTWEITGSDVYLVGCKINGVTYGDTLLTDVENISSEVPSAFSLSQNYPNPFNPVTKIKFELPSVADPLWRKGYGVSQGVGLVKLIVYDITGREVQTLVNERLQPGTYETTFDGSQLTSGIYFYQMVSGDFKQTRKLILLK
jgi:hypothetical protein